MAFLSTVHGISIHLQGVLIWLREAMNQILILDIIFGNCLEQVCWHVRKGRWGHDTYPGPP